LRHLAAFLALPALLLLTGEAVLQGSGEVWPVSRVLAFQRAHPDSLYMRGIDQSFYAYKYRAVLDRRPAIVAAGSSRMMKFRAPMFGDRAASFYNAAGMLNSLRDVRDFCVSLPPSRTPAVLLLGVDLWWLNERVPPTFNFDDEIAKDAASSFDEHIIGIRWLLSRPRLLFGEAFSLLRRTKGTAIGITARERGGGFRPDGSLKSLVEVPRTGEAWVFIDRETPPIVERVKNAVANFPPSSGISPERLALLDEVLAEYEKKQVLVIGYLPPFSSEVVAQLESDPRHSRLWSDFRRAVPELFRRHGFPVFDASETGSVGQDDRALSDGFHAEETFQVHAMKALLRDARVRSALPGAEAVVDRALASPTTNYWEADLGS